LPPKQATPTLPPPLPPKQAHFTCPPPLPLRKQAQLTIPPPLPPKQSQQTKKAKRNFEEQNLLRRGKKGIL